MVEPPLNIKPYAVKQFWHPRFNADPAIRWLRESVVRLFGPQSDAVRSAKKARNLAKARGNVGLQDHGVRFTSRSSTCRAGSDIEWHAGCACDLLQTGHAAGAWSLVTHSRRICH